MTTATHINKKTGLQVNASVNSWKASNGETTVSYRMIKDGDYHGPIKSAFEARFNQMYAPL